MSTETETFDPTQDASREAKLWREIALRKDAEVDTLTETLETEEANASEIFDALTGLAQVIHRAFDLADVKDSVAYGTLVSVLAERSHGANGHPLEEAE